MKRKFKLIKEYPLGPEIDTIVELSENDTPTIYDEHPEFWEEIKKPTYYGDIMSIKREDGVIFTIGDKVCVNSKKATCKLTISGFVEHPIKNSYIMCVTTEEKNGFGDGLINIDILRLEEESSLMTKPCLSVKDYCDVLKEQDKSFLFAPTMIKHLMKKVHGKSKR